MRALFLLIGLAACESPLAEPRVATEVRLTAFADCDALESHLETRATDQLAAELDALNSAGFDPIPMLPATRLRPSAIATQRDGAPLRPDRIARDDQRVFVLDGDRLRAIRIDPLEESQSIQLDHHPDAILIAGPHLYLLGGTEQTTITVVDRDALEVVATALVPSRWIDAAPADFGIDLILVGGLAPIGLDVATYIDPQQDDAAKRAELLRARTLDEWIPPLSVDGAPVLRDCRAYLTPSSPVRLDLTRVLRVRMDDRLEIVERAILGEAKSARMTDGTGVVALPHWWSHPEPGQSSHTYLFSLALTRNGAEPIGAALVPGVPQTTEAFHFADGTLRLFTAVDRRVPDATNPWGRTVRTHQLHLLDLGPAGPSLRASSADLLEAQTVRNLVKTETDLVINTEEGQLIALSAESLTPRTLAAEGRFDRLAALGDRLVGVALMETETEIHLIDAEGAGRPQVVAVPLPIDAAPASITLDLDLSRGHLGAPAFSSAAIPPNANVERPLAVRLYDLSAGRLDLFDTVDFTYLSLEREAPLDLLRTFFLEDRTISVSNAGVRVMAQGDLRLTTSTLIFK